MEQHNHSMEPAQPGAEPDQEVSEEAIVFGHLILSDVP